MDSVEDNRLAGPAAAALGERTRTNIAKRILNSHWRWIAIAGLPVDPEGDQSDLIAADYATRLSATPVTERSGRMAFTKLGISRRSQLAFIVAQHNATA